ncbi:hypothetical protein ACA910_017317 [Epithemia clementina (nom. ined.)]
MMRNGTLLLYRAMLLLVWSAVVVVVAADAAAATTTHEENPLDATVAEQHSVRRHHRQLRPSESNTAMTSTTAEQAPVRIRSTAAQHRHHRHHHRRLEDWTDDGKNYGISSTANTIKKGTTPKKSDADADWKWANSAAAAVRIPATKDQHHEQEIKSANDMDDDGVQMILSGNAMGGGGMDEEEFQKWYNRISDEEKSDAKQWDGDDEEELKKDANDMAATKQWEGDDEEELKKDANDMASKQLDGEDEEELKKDANDMASKQWEGDEEELKKDANGMTAAKQLDGEDEEELKNANDMTTKQWEGDDEEELKKDGNGIMTKQLDGEDEEELKKDGNGIMTKQLDGEDEEELKKDGNGIMTKQLDGEDEEELKKDGNGIMTKQLDGEDEEELKKDGNGIMTKQLDGEDEEELKKDGNDMTTKQWEGDDEEELKKDANGMQGTNVGDHGNREPYRSGGGDEEEFQKSANFIDVTIGGGGSSSGSGGYNNNNDRTYKDRPPPTNSGVGGTYGMTQWEIAQMKDFMAIADVTHSKLPLGIENGAPDFSLFIASNGYVGYGTTYPAANVHVVGDAPFVRLEHGGPGSSTPSNSSPRYYGGPEQIWDIAASDKGFFVSGESRDRRELPFQIQAGAKTLSLVVAADGQVGLGTDSPKAKLHVLGSARIDGTLSVGSCQLDAYTCQWKRNSRRRQVRHLEQGDEESVQDEEMKEGLFSEEDEEYESSWANDMVAHLELLQEENKRDKETIRSMKTHLESLEERMMKHEARLMQRIQELEHDVAGLKSQPM